MSDGEAPAAAQQAKSVVDMSWDPISRVVGSLGIHARIDFANGVVADCHSTSSIFRGYAVFMRGKDPRDAAYITSRICGICGDNHATCALYAQNMAFGIRPPAMAEWIINLGEAAEYMFDHNLFQDNMLMVDFCEQVVRRTNPSVLARAERTPAPRADRHGYRTVADIMRAFNPFTGELYLKTLEASRSTREMFCLMEGRHPHPSTLYPGGVGTIPTTQLFTDYLSRLLSYIELMKRIVPLHDDIFDFFYEALPGYEEVGRRRVDVLCAGAFNDPARCDYTYANMSDWGRAMYVTPGVVLDGRLVTTDLVEINRGLRVMLGHSFYEDWAGGGQTYVDVDPTGGAIDARHPWNVTTTPRPARRDFADRYSWVMSPRFAHAGEAIAVDTGGGAFARLLVTSLAGLVNVDGITATGHSTRIMLPRTATLPAVELEWTVPRWSNALERNRARTYFQAYAAACALHFVDRALEELRAGRRATVVDARVPDEAAGCGFHEAVRGCLSHHVVIRDGRIANYNPLPPTSWNASPRDSAGTLGPFEDAVRGTPILEESRGDDFTGIDILRAVRSFDPCLPCGVHMYLGGGRVLEVRHLPTFGAQP